MAQTTQCRLCGTPFLSKQVARPRVYCSAACARQRYQAGTTPRKAWSVYTFTPAMEATLAKVVRQGYGALRRLVEKDPRFAAIPYATVKYHAMKHRPGQKNVAWTEAEDRLLTSGAIRSLATWQTVLRKQGFPRSHGAIAGRLRQLGESARQGEWSLPEIAAGFGCDLKVVHRWADKGWLSTTATAGGHRYTTSEALRRMLRENPQVAQVGTCDTVWLISLLLDPGSGNTQHEAKTTGSAGSYEPEGPWYNSEYAA